MGLFGRYDNGGGTRRFHWVPILIVIVVGGVYYFGNREENPYTGRKQMITLSPDEENSLGISSYSQILRSSKVIREGPLADLVRKVGERLARASGNSNYQWEFSLLQSPQANAFCLPGGKVAVYSGILDVTKNEAGLAIVMGHEIAHALARHGAERMAHERLAQIGQVALQVATGDMDYQQRRAIMGAFGIGAQYGVLLPFSRDHESEADHLGLLLAARACYDPAEAPKFWKRMAESSRGAKPPEFLSTHPSDSTRIAQLEEWAPEALTERNRICDR